MESHTPKEERVAFRLFIQGVNSAFRLLCVGYSYNGQNDCPPIAMCTIIIKTDRLALCFSFAVAKIVVIILLHCTVPTPAHTCTLYLSCYVYLPPVPNYINLMQGYKQKRGFIIAQAPLSNTTGDFWKMVYEREVAVIVMLSEFYECGKVIS